MRQVRLGDFLEVQAGFAFKTEYFTSGEGMPLIRIRDLDQSQTVINYSGEYKPDFLVNRGDYLIGMDGNFRCYRWQGQTSLLNQRVCRLRNFQEGIEPEYVFYGIQRKLQEIENNTSFVTVKHLSAKQVQNIEMPLPPLPEQRRIVDLLSRAEGIVRLRREAEKKAAELIPALFLDMFGDPATNPKGWQMKPLQSVAEVGSGNGFPNTYQGKTEGEFPFYKVSDMNTKGNEVEMLGANNYISAEDLNALRAKAFPVGTVIFPKIGAAIATNKKRMLTQPSCFDNNVMGITVGRDLLPTYVHALMVSKNLSDFASDSNPPSIRKTTVEAWEIPVPLISLQSEFANRVETIRSIQNQQSSATAKAQATFDALLAKAFSNNEANV